MIVVLVPVPVVTVPPGVLVSVQVPDGGKSLKTTLPVATAHVGCVIVPITGAVANGLTVTTELPDCTCEHDKPLEP